MTRKRKMSLVGNCFCAVFSLMALFAFGDVSAIFVKTPENGGNDANSGESWDAAKATIGEALNAVAVGGTVTVGPGTYVVTAIGTKVGTNPALAVTDGVRLVSSEGPEKTIIAQDRDTAVDKSTILNLGGVGTVVSGFAISDFVSYGVNFTAAGATLTNCIVRNLYPKNLGCSGAGVYISSAAGTVIDCVISNNEVYVSGNSGRNGIGMVVQAKNSLVSGCIFANNRCRGTTALNSASGGGSAINITAAGAVVRNCLIAGNCDDFKNGAAVKMSAGTLESCTIVSNITTGSASCGGLWLNGSGVITLRNNILYGNLSSGSNPNWKSDALSVNATYCNAAPQFDGEGNMSVDPNFTDGWALGASDCVDGGTNQTWMADAVDLAGNDRIVNGIVDMGCFEKTVGTLEVSFVRTPNAPCCAPYEVTFTARPMGTDLTGLSYKWEFNDPSIEDAEGSEYADVTRTFGVGSHTVKLTIANAAQSTAEYVNAFQVGPKVAYVSRTGSHEFPYDTKATAATNVSAALEAAVDGSRIEVAAGIYQVEESIRLSKDIVLCGANASTTVLDAGGRAISVVELANDGAFVEGFTITGSRLRGLAISSKGVVSNCVICGNSCTTQNPGPGVWFAAAGTLTHCIITNNHISVGGYASSGCAVYSNTPDYLIDTCMIAANTGSGGSGLGSVYCSEAGTIRNTVIVGNTQGNGGGGVYAMHPSGMTLVENCTICDNSSAVEGAGLTLGGANGRAVIRNTIVYGNAAAGEASDCLFTSGNGEAWNSILNNVPTTFDGAKVSYEDPKLNGKFRPRVGSPCIDAGTNQTWMVGAKDVYGRDRIISGIVDLGAAEFKPSGLMLFVK